MRIKVLLLLSLLMIGSGATSIAQQMEAPVADSSVRIGVFRPYPFFDNSPVLNKPRVYTVTGTIAGLYTVSNIWWSSAWYKQFPKSRFHFFNDAEEWLQMDKAGHMFSAYFLNRWGANMYKWAGVKPNAATWIGFAGANLWQLSIEMQDAFSEEWGFSLSDLAANMTGSLLYVMQHYLWDEQRITIKLSAWPEKYPVEFKDRAEDLYGTSFGELVLKDYNANTFWLSASIGSFIRKDTRFPDWINFAFGYGAKNLYGGFSNCWCELDGVSLENCPAESVNTSAADIERIRQFYLSFDIDWTRIPVKSNAVKTLFEILNIIKLPFPAVEFNTGGEVNWHWIMF